MFRLLSQPYPSDDTPLRQLRKAALIGLFIGLFLLLFQPFGLNNWQTPDKSLKVLGFGLITFVITAFNFIAGPRLLPRQFSDMNWTVGREILLVTGNILLIAVANRLYLMWLLGQHQVSGISWLGMILVTFLVALFPVTGVVLINYITQLKKYSREAAELPLHPVPHSTSPAGLPEQKLPDDGPAPADSALTLIADNEKDALTLPSENLLYIESSDNYCTVVYLSDTPSRGPQLVKPLLRSSLSRLEGQINAAHIVRCHRSFVVNLDRVERVTGNAQGYKLHLLGGQFQIPVARKYNDSLVRQLKSMA